jgi:hypothetical protein
LFITSRIHLNLFPSLFGIPNANIIIFIQANPGLYKGVGDGFRTIKADKGLKGFTLVSIYIITFKTKNTLFEEIFF